MLTRPLLPPFTRDTAIQKVRHGEDAWKSCGPEKVSLAYSADSRRRNRSEFIQGRKAGNCRLLETQVGKGIGVSTDQGTLGRRR